MDPHHFGFLDPDSQKYADPRIRLSKGQNINQKMLGNFFSLQSQIWTYKKRNIEEVLYF